MSYSHLEMVVQEVRSLIESQSNIHAAQYGAAHIIFADQNLDRDWIREAAYEKADSWLDYLSQRRKDRPEEDPQKAINEVTHVIDVLLLLLDYPDEILELVEETYR